MTLRSAVQCSFLFSTVFLPLSLLRAQGFLPPPTTSTGAATSGQTATLLIGEQVPDTLLAMEDNGKKRTLLSYKAAVDILVVEFLSARCPAPQAGWHDLTRFYDRYKNWRVSFVAVNAGPAASVVELTEAMNANGLSFPLLKQEAHDLVHRLGIQEVPEMAIIDESGYLKYRGPFGKQASDAIDAVIGHIEPVPTPEPAMVEGCAIP
jgi:peroxiredoxin